MAMGGDVFAAAGGLFDRGRYFRVGKLIHPKRIGGR